MAQTASAAVDRRGVALEHQPEEADLAVGGEQEQAGGDHPGGGAGEPGRRAGTRRPPRAGRRCARASSQTRGAAPPDEREHAGDQHRAAASTTARRRCRGRGDRPRAPDQPRPHVVGRARGDQQRHDGDRRARGDDERRGAPRPATTLACRRGDAQAEVPSVAGAKSPPADHDDARPRRRRPTWSRRRSGCAARGRSGGAAASPGRGRGTCGDDHLAPSAHLGCGRSRRTDSGRITTSTGPAAARSIGKHPSSHSTVSRRRRRRCSTSASPRNSAIQRVAGCG